MNVNKMFAELRKVDRNLVPCPFSTSVSIQCMEKNYSFLQLFEFVLLRGFVSGDIFKISKCWEMDIAVHALPEANNAVLLDASGFSWVWADFAEGNWGSEELTFWSEHVDERKTLESTRMQQCNCAYRAFHEFAGANTSEFHFEFLKLSSESWTCVSVHVLHTISKVWKESTCEWLDEVDVVFEQIVLKKSTSRCGKSFGSALSLEQSRWVVKSDLVTPDLKACMHFCAQNMGKKW